MVYYRYPRDYEESYYIHLPLQLLNKLDNTYQKDIIGSWRLEESNLKTNDKAELQEQKISPEEFKVIYPIVSNLEEATRKKVNAAITDTVTTLLKNNILVSTPVNFKSIISDYDVPLNEKELMSILFELYYYTGGAHGNTVYDSLSVDLKTGEIYKLGDLFNPKFNYIPLLNEVAVKKAKESGVPLLTEYKGLAKDQKFYLAPKALVLYYQLYEYTPYAYGRFEVKIPYAEIQNLLYPLSPIQKLL